MQFIIVFSNVYSKLLPSTTGIFNFNFFKNMFPFTVKEKLLEQCKLRRIAHSKASRNVTLDEGRSDGSTKGRETNCGDTTFGQICSSEPHLLTQDLSDLIRDLKLPKNQTEMLGSRLKEWNLLQ